MIKYLLSALILATIPFLSPAQSTDQKPPEKKTRKIYLDLTGGVSLVAGKAYPSTDIGNSRAGFASTGYFIQPNFVYLGKSHFGIGVQYTFQHNPLKSGTSTDTLIGTKYPLGTKGWSNNYLMVGPAYIQSFNKVVLQAEAMIGFMLAFSPVFNDTDPGNGSNHTNTASGVCLGFRVGTGYMVTSHLALMLNVNYLAGFPAINKKYGPQFIGIDPNTGESIYSLMTEVKINKTTSAFNIGAGLMYKF